MAKFEPCSPFCEHNRKQDCGCPPCVFIRTVTGFAHDAAYCGIEKTIEPTDRANHGPAETERGPQGT